MSADPTDPLKQARAFFTAARYDDAEAAARQALAIDPRRAEALYLIGMTHLERNHNKLAAEFLSKAIDIDSTIAEFHLNLGSALRALSELDAAARAFERAAQLKPDYPLAWHNLAAARRAQGKLDDAINAYQKAVSLRPDFAPSYLNLGNALKDAGRLNEAIAAYGRAVALKPHNPDTTSSLGAAMMELGQLNEAIEYFNKSLKNHPNHLPSLIHRAAALRRLRRIDEAIASLRLAVRASPTSAEAHQKLARLLWETGSMAQALENYEKALELRPTPHLRLTAATLVPPVYHSASDVLAWRESLNSSVAALTRQNIRVDLAHQPTRPPAYISYAGFNDRDLLRDIAHLHAPPPDPAPLLTDRSDRIRVGFVSAFFRDHPVGLWTQGLIAQLSFSASPPGPLSREQFEVIVISARPASDPVAASIREHADQFLQLSPLLPLARRAIADLDLDILIYADLGTDAFTHTLAFSRLAPIQCVLWTHPVTSGIPTIDYFISSDLAEPEHAENHYTEQLIRLRNLPLYYDRPPAPRQQRTRADFGLPDDLHLYACLQSTYKFHPDFDAALIGILERDRDALLLIPQGLYPQWDQILLSRLTSQSPGIDNRIRFLPRLERDDFRGLIGLCDVLLSPFPFGAADTSLEAFAQGVPVISRPGEFLRGRFTHAMYQSMQIPDCTADTIEDYITLATRTATDADFRRSVSEKILAANSILYENPTGIRDLESFLHRARIS